MEIPIITRKFLIESKAAAQENTESNINKEICGSLGDVLRQEYPSSVLHHACFPAPSALLIIDFLRKLAPDGAQTYSESRIYARRTDGKSG